MSWELLERLRVLWGCDPVMTGYTLADPHLNALRDIVAATTTNDAAMALPSPVLETLRALCDCDFVIFEGVDYGGGYSYFSQGRDIDTERFRDCQPGEKDAFWTLVRSSPLIQPWIPDDESATVINPSTSCPSGSGAACPSMWTHSEPARPPRTR